MEKNLKDLIREGEGQMLEFKRTINSLEKIAKTMSALANSRGGDILVGVEDNGRLVGVNVEEEIFMIEQAAEFYCKPAVAVMCHEVEMDDVFILHVEVLESEVKPHHCIDTHGLWRCYVRSGDQCLMAADSVIKSMRDQTALREGEGRRLYTANELKLMEYLNARKKITVKDYAKLINVSKRRAGRILIDLIRHGEIYEHDYNDISYYTLAS